MQWRPLDTEVEGLQNGTLLIPRSNGSTMVMDLFVNTSYVVQAFSTNGSTILHDFGIPLQGLLTTVEGPAGRWNLLFVSMVEFGGQN